MEDLEWYSLEKKTEGGFDSSLQIQIVYHKEDSYQLPLVATGAGQKILKLQEGGFRLDTRKNFLTVGCLAHQNRQLWEAVESLLLELFKCS